MNYKNKVSQFLQCIPIKFLMNVRLLFGFYGDNFDDRMISRTAKLYCCLIAIILFLHGSYAVAYDPYMFFKSLTSGFRVMAVYMEYLFHVLFALFTDGGHCYKFCCKLSEVGGTFEVPSAPISAIYFILILLVSVANTFFTCLFSKSLCQWFGINKWFIRAIIKIALTLHGVAVIIILELTLYKMKTIRKTFDDLTVTFKDSENDQQTLIMKIKQAIKEYKHAMDTLEMTDGIRRMVLVIVIAVVYRILTHFYDIIVGQSFWLSQLIIRVISCILDGTPLYICCILSSFIVAEHNAIIIGIEKKIMIMCQANESRKVLEDSLIYLTMRPYKYTVLRIFSIDITLIVSLFTFITSYMIIVVQFLHIF